MPKGNAAQRRIQKELQELRDYKARTERAPIVKPMVYDWVCSGCEFYCYFDKDRCPKCGCSKGLGQPRPGYKRRIRVDSRLGTPEKVLPVARVLGPLIPPTRRVLQQQVQNSAAQQAGTQRTYLEAAKLQAERHSQQHLLKQTHQQQQTIQQLQQLQAQQLQQQQIQSQDTGTGQPQTTAASIVHTGPACPTVRPTGLQISSSAVPGPRA